MKVGLGEVGTNLLKTLSIENKNIFTVEDAANILNKNKHYVRNLLYELTKKKWIFRMKRGKYLVLPLESGLEGEFTEHEFVIASHLINPYYIGYWSALNYHSYTEQVSKTIFVATIKRMRNLEIKGLRYYFVTLSKKKFFGYEKSWVENKPILLSDKEKTIVDCLDHPEYCGGITEVSKGLFYGRDDLNFEKIVEYAKKDEKLYHT